jgi:hypothetical protein
MATTRSTGTRDTTYDLISVIYHALQGVETYQTYMRDAERAGDRDAATFFREAQEQNRLLADRAKELLAQRMGQDGMVRSSRR